MISINPLQQTCRPNQVLGIFGFSWAAALLSFAGVVTFRIPRPHGLQGFFRPQGGGFECTSCDTSLSLVAAALTSGSFPSSPQVEPPPDVLLGYSELRTDLPGGRYVNVRTMRAVTVKADGTGRRVRPFLYPLVTYRQRLGTAWKQMLH